MLGEAAAGLSAGTVQIIVAAIGALGTIVSAWIAVVVSRTHNVSKRTEQTVNGRMTYLQNEVELLRRQLETSERRNPRWRDEP